MIFLLDACSLRFAVVIDTNCAIVFWFYHAPDIVPQFHFTSLHCVPFAVQGSEIVLALHLTSPLRPVGTADHQRSLHESLTGSAAEQQGRGTNARAHVESIGIRCGPWLVLCFRLVVITVAFVGATAVTAGCQLGGRLFRGEPTGRPSLVGQATQMTQAIEKPVSLWALQLQRLLVRRRAHVEYVRIGIAPHVRGVFARCVANHAGCICNWHPHHHPHKPHHSHNHHRHHHLWLGEEVIAHCLLPWHPLLRTGFISHQ